MVYKEIQRLAIVQSIKVVIIYVAKIIYSGNFVSINSKKHTMRTYVIASLLILFTTLMSCGNAKSTMPAEMLVGKTWQLTSMNGKTVSAPASGRGLPHITFTTDNKAMGNSGCNNFSGSYNLNDEGGLNISQVMATKMFCEGVNEGGFFDALDKVTTSKVEKDKLTLMNGTAEILVFVPKQ